MNMVIHFASISELQTLNLICIIIKKTEEKKEEGAIITLTNSNLKSCQKKLAAD